MKINGKQLAQEIRDSLRERVALSKKQLRLAIIQVGDVDVSARFIRMKQKCAEEIGGGSKVYNFSKDISTTNFRKEIAKITLDKKNHGVIIQLPLPKHLNTQYILNSIPTKKDVDVLSSKSFGFFATKSDGEVLPPVVGAVKTILEKGGVDVKNKSAVVVGRGALVGKPVAMWLINQGATVSVLNSKTPDISKFTRDADIIISGVGKPNLITSDMVKDEVVVIDAATSEQSGQLVGDIDPEIEKIASVFTPVPGGVGPLTVVYIFKNLLILNGV